MKLGKKELIISIVMLIVFIIIGLNFLFLQQAHQFILI